MILFQLIKIKFKHFLRKWRQGQSFQIIKREIRRKKKINVGSGNIGFHKDWYSCDKNLLDITNKDNWRNLLGSFRLDNIFAEHVWEHLTNEEVELANNNCYHFLRKRGRLRIAVPDGFHPDKNYIDYVRPNGMGVGSDDHKVLFNYKTLSSKLEKVGFKIELIEFWDENGIFHSCEWSIKHGKVRRSAKYDSRNNRGKLNYTSLIIDGIKL